MKLFKYVFATALWAVIVLMNAPAQAGEVKLSWKAPKTPPNFVHYLIHWGVKSGNYTQKQTVKSNATSATIKNLKANNTYYFAATTVTKSGQESKYSNEVSVTLEAPPKPPDTDTDKDGIPDKEERKYGTDPNRADTDGDGIDDGKELAFWKDKWNQDADGDGLINLLDPDADGDGVNDGSELADGTDPLDDKSFNDPDSDPEPVPDLLPVVAVAASKHDNKNVAKNAIDGKIKTYWAAKGKKQWLQLDIGTYATVEEVAIAWYKGDRRRASFTIHTSVDRKNWKQVYKGKSSGKTADFESYTFASKTARYVRITGYGNSWNKGKHQGNRINEVELYGQPNTVPLPIETVEASDAQAPHEPANTIDGVMATHWAAEGDGQWVSYDVGDISSVSEMAIAWFQGDQQQASFSIEVSIDNKAWDEVFSGNSSGATSDFESYSFPAAIARYVRVVGYGNTADNWIRVAETEIYGQMDSISLAIVASKASKSKKGRRAAQAIDGKLNTRWSGYGKKQWIQFDMGRSARVDELAIAWYKGNSRKAYFDILVSQNGKKWRKVFGGKSRGKTKNFESYTFSSVSARYIRVKGYGNSSNKWNEISEVEIYGLPE